MSLIASVLRRATMGSIPDPNGWQVSINCALNAEMRP